MHVPHSLVFVIIEVIVVLLVICGTLLLYARNIRSLLSRQQQRLRAAVKTPASKSSGDTLAEEAGTDSLAYLRTQLEQTLQHFTQLVPEVDIEQADSLELPPMALIAAIRYELLSAELEALPKGINSEGQWHALDARLTPLVGGGDEHLRQCLATSNKRLKNLEKFKNLFFSMEKQWDSARKDAQKYYQELQKLAREFNIEEQLTPILDKYHNIYNDINDSIAQTGKQRAKATDTHSGVTTVTKANPNTGHELDKLRSVADNQHQTIKKLQERLRNAESAEDKERVIGDLQVQLDNQARYLKESDTCIQLLEHELNTTLAKLNDYEHEARDNKILIKQLEELQQENQQLHTIAKDNTASDETTAAALKTLKTQHEQLKAQYAELEEKYLDTKLG